MNPSEQLLSERLHALVPDVPLTIDPAALEGAARRRHRSRGAAVLTVIALVAAGSVVGTSIRRRAPEPSPPAILAALPVKSSSDLRPYVHQARLTQSVTFDDGSLLLDPPTVEPTLTEDRALELFRAGAGPVSETRNVVVVLANVTVRVPSQAPSVPTFQRTTAWVVVHELGPHFCALITTPPNHVPEPTQIALIAADGSQRGVEYRTAGSVCNRPVTGPTADVLSYLVSVPWAIRSRTSKTVTVGTTELPACSGSAPSLEIAKTATGPTTVTIYASAALHDEPCPVNAPSTFTFDVVGPLAHGTLGLPKGYATDGSGLTYFDGAERRSA